MLNMIFLFILFHSLLRFSHCMNHYDPDSMTISCNETTECCSPSCIEAAQIIRSSMNLKMDPCEDFYEFSCGGFINSTEMADYETRVNRHTMLRNKINNLLEDMVNTSIEVDDPKPVQFAKTFYQTCVDDAAIRNNCIQSLVNITEKLGGWPVLSDLWNESSTSLAEQLKKFDDFGYDDTSLFQLQFTVEEEPGLLLITIPLFNLLEDEVEKGWDDPKVQLYYKLMIDTVVAFGGNESKVRDEMKAVLDFEIELKEISVLDDGDSVWNNKFFYGLDMDYINEFQENNDTRVFPLRVLPEKYPGFPWIEYVKDIYSPYHNFTLDETVYIMTPLFLDELMTLLNQTDKRTIFNFLFWRLTSYVLVIMSNEIVDFEMDIFNATLGEIAKTPRPERCMEKLKVSLTAEMVHYYVEKYFDESRRREASNVAENIRNQFIASLTNITWMTEVTRDSTIKKVQNMKLDVAYPAIIKNLHFVEEYYSELVLNNNSYLENMFQMDAYRKKRDRRYSFFGNMDTDFLERVVKVYTSYIYEKNEMILPAGLLNGVFFDLNRTNFLNYGGIGISIGKEISHSFDQQGKHYDDLGGYKDWWDPATSSAYHERATCFMYQYGNVTVEQIGRKIDGKKTLIENIADNIGFMQSYLAYRNWSRMYWEEKKLPGLEYSPEQLLWLQSANSLCETVRNASLLETVQNSKQSPSKYRVNIALGNSPYFRQDWNCSARSKMSFNKTCSMW